MPPDDGNGACIVSEEETPMLKDPVKLSTPVEFKAGYTRRLLPIKDAVKLLLLIDFVSVATIMPLLSSYFKDLNISPEQYGLMSSVYSLSQIVGGLVLGALSDRIMSRRSVLLLSFLGSALSYGAIGLSSSLSMLVAGRVVVGLVKQTMTISTAIVSEHTAKEHRSAELSKLTAAMTFAFMVGPAFGSFLYKRNKKLPPLVSCSLFLLNAVLALILLPPGNSKGAGREVASAAAAAVSSAAKKKSDDVVEGDDDGMSTAGGAAPGGSGEGQGGKREEESSSSPPSRGRFVENFRKACSSRPVLQILAAKLGYGFLMRALGSQNFVGYFEERFNIESGSLGFMSSYRACLSFVVQLYVVGRLVSWKSETSLVAASLGAITLTNLAEGTPAVFDFRAYLILLVPLSTVANSALQACLQSILTQRIPLEDLGAALGVLNVLSSASGVLAPLYGGEIIGYLGVMARPRVNAAHYAAFFVLWYVMEVWRRGKGRGDPKSSRAGGDGLRESPDRKKIT
ncbi:unnamed protein product [Scytosiphon promiscuus]